MAVYKVPQDVEAEDKLLGPFSFRQFIYLIIAGLGILMAYLLSQLFVGLAIVPLPLIALFLVLALPLRKDQPMETYLIALVSFFLKPRRRMWVPDGAVGMVQITAPKVIEQQLTKGFGGEEAAYRLNYLAQVVDTRGWATRGVANSNGIMIEEAAAEAAKAEDMLDDQAGISQSFDNMIAKNDTSYKQTVMQQFQQAIQQPPQQGMPLPTLNPQPQPQPTPAPVLVQPEPQLEPAAVNTAPPQRSITSAFSYQPTNDDSSFDYNPYPNSMHQKVIDPSGRQAPTPPAQPPVEQKQTAPSEPPVSPDIMRLASNNDLSISAIAREAHRIEDKDEQEVVISLR